MQSNTEETHCASIRFRYIFLYPFQKLLLLYSYNQPVFLRFHLRILNFKTLHYKHCHHWLMGMWKAFSITKKKSCRKKLLTAARGKNGGIYF